MDRHGDTSQHRMPINNVQKLQFSLLSLFGLTGFVALYFGLRSCFVFSGVGPSELFFRAHLMPPFFAILSVAYLSVRPTLSWRRRMLMGSLVACVVASALTIEIAEGFRLVDYWHWETDWIWFLEIVGFHACTGGISSGIVMLLFAGVSRMIRWWG